MTAILALDPSSTRTGYAVMAGPADIVEAGYLKPIRATVPAVERILAMMTSLVALIGEHNPSAIVIEVPSGHVAGRLQHKNVVGHSIYGMGVGVMLLAAYQAMLRTGGEFCYVDENTWTRSIPKRVRQRAIALQFPAYRDQLAKDYGADVADAIGIGVWWFTQQRLEKRLGLRTEAVLREGRSIRCPSREHR